MTNEMEKGRKKRENSQHEYVIETITKHYSDFSDNSSILSQSLLPRFIDGSAMRATSHAIHESLICNECKYIDGIYTPRKNIEEWLPHTKKRNILSSEAYIYDAEPVQNVQCVLKTPRHPVECYKNGIREYYIGRYLNSLRNIIPNFVYTFGLCKTDNGTYGTIFESVPGTTLEYALKNNKITFIQFIRIYTQILLSLEIAQRDCNFTHFDLHTGNVILRPVQTPFASYVLFDEQKYEIYTEDFVPTIIDFGMSTIDDGTRTVGSYTFSMFGMYNFPIPGVDMYKLLFYSYYHSNGVLHRQIGELITFFSDRDPYKILLQNRTGLKNIAKEFVKKVSTSYIATYTPLQFANWIMKKYSCIDTNIKVKKRDMYKSISLAYLRDWDTEYLDTFLGGYLLPLYVTNILLQKDTKTDLESNRKKYISTDKKNMLLYMKIEPPDLIKLQNNINRILNMPFDNVDIDIIEEFINQAEFYYKIRLFLRLVYIIRELRLHKKYKTYSTFIKAFFASPQYLFYTQIRENVQRTIRWSITLFKV